MANCEPTNKDPINPGAQDDHPVLGVPADVLEHEPALFVGAEAPDEIGPVGVHLHFEDPVLAAEPEVVVFVLVVGSAPESVPSSSLSARGSGGRRCGRIPLFRLRLEPLGEFEDLDQRRVGGAVVEVGEGDVAVEGGPALHFLVAAALQVGLLLGVGTTAAVDADVVEALPAFVEEVLVDAAAAGRLDHLPHHRPVVGEGDLHRDLGLLALVLHLGVVGAERHHHPGPDPERRQVVEGVLQVVGDDRHLDRLADRPGVVELGRAEHGGC